MKKIMVGVLIIAIICISSGAYAVLSENAEVSKDNNINIEKITNDNTNTSNNDIQVKSVNFKESIAGDNFKETIWGDNSNTAPTIQASFVKQDDPIVKVGKYAHYVKSDGLEDRYIMCVECGGYVPIGEVTTPLPDAALCHNFMGYLGPSYQSYSLSYDEAYKIWVDNGQRIQNDGSEHHIDTHISQEIIDHNTGADEGLQNVVLDLSDDSTTAEALV